jgi:uncharacterized protein with FMN-binding domain
MIKKILLSVITIVGFGAYAGFIRQDESTKDIGALSALPTPEETVTPTATPTIIATRSPLVTASPQATVTPTPTSTPTAAGQYKNGTYTGLVADAFYGNIQVRATIAGGKLTGVDFLQYPNDRGESISINTRAIPVLRQEAIQAQSGSVRIVSGATDSSLAFRQSLTDALNKAK